MAKFSVDEVRKQLAGLGYTDLPDTVLEEFMEGMSSKQTFFVNQVQTCCAWQIKRVSPSP
jgi:hypothetical protein